MHTAVLDHTRAYFNISDNPSVLAALGPAVFWGAVARSAGKSGDQTPQRPPRARMALLASVVLGPAALGMVYEPWKGTPDHSAGVQERSPLELGNESEAASNRTGTFA